jgi:hypothetical protein
MTFKNFIDKAHKGKITSSDLEGIVHVRVPAAEGLVLTIGERAAPVYLSTIKVPNPHHQEAVERALRSAAD